MRALQTFQSFGFRQLGLSIIERPKSFGFQFEGTGNVQTIKRADSEFRDIPAGNVRRALEGVLRYASVKPQSGNSVARQLIEDLLGTDLGYLAIENLLSDSMETLGEMKGRKPHAGRPYHPAPCRRGMDIG